MHIAAKLSLPNTLKASGFPLVKSNYCNLPGFFGLQIFQLCKSYTCSRYLSPSWETDIFVALPFLSFSAVSDKTFLKIGSDIII